MKNVLIVTGSTKGSTAEMGEKMKGFLEEAGCAAQTVSVDNGAIDVQPYDLIILGSGIYGARPHPGIPKFIGAHRSALSEKKVAVFAACAMMSSPREQKRRQAMKFGTKVAGRLPTVSAMTFAGNVPGPDPKGFVGWLMNTFIGVTKTGDFRDWDAIRSWVLSLVK